WGSEVFVDFDRSLNVCIAQIRAALNDDSEAPRYIQTVPRRGYRFVAPVEQGSAPPPAKAAPRPSSRMALAIAVLTSAGAGLFLWHGAQPARRIVIAVLPFENVTQRQDDAPLIDGLGDELITQFGAVAPAALGVIGRTSVMRYRDRKADLGQIAHDLGVDY